MVGSFGVLACFLLFYRVKTLYLLTRTEGSENAAVFGCLSLFSSFWFFPFVYVNHSTNKQKPLYSRTDLETLTA